MKTHVVIKSDNTKLGPMAATYRTQDSCPTSCPFLNNGCYASGRIFAIPRKYGVGQEDLDELVEKLIEEVELGGMIRWEVSGDIHASNDRWIEKSNWVAFYRPDLDHIRFTHRWKGLSPDQFHYPVNASCETESEVEDALAEGWEAVMTVEQGSEWLDGQHFIAGKRVIQCPNQTHGVTCYDCKLCSKKRGVVIAFEAHGAGKRKVKLAVEAKREKE